MTALLALGAHVFDILPLNYQSLDRETTAEWASIARFGGQAAKQGVGIGSGDGLTIEGLLFPQEFGGRAEFEAIRITQRALRPVMMVGFGTGGAGRIFGNVVIERVSDAQEHIAPNGAGRKWAFSVDVSPYGGGAAGQPGGLF